MARRNHLRIRTTGVRFIRLRGALDVPAVPLSTFRAQASARPFGILMTSWFVLSAPSQVDYAVLLNVTDHKNRSLWRSWMASHAKSCKGYWFDKFSQHVGTEPAAWPWIPANESLNLNFVMEEGKQNRQQQSTACKVWQRRSVPSGGPATASSAAIRTGEATAAEAAVATARGSMSNADHSPVQLGQVDGRRLERVYAASSVETSSLGAYLSAACKRASGLEHDSGTLIGVSPEILRSPWDGSPTGDQTSNEYESTINASVCGPNGPNGPPICPRHATRSSYTNDSSDSSSSVPAPFHRAIISYAYYSPSER